MNQLVKQVKEWFESNGLTTAVVGFSGGVDSATTIALLRTADIETYAVILSADNQSYTSDPTSDQNVDWLYSIGAYSSHFLLGIYPFEDDAAANEAWLPVARIAALDGYTAALRARGDEAILVGTVNLSEYASSFFGLRSDAACDFYPISHLTKTEVYHLAKELGVPDSIICAVPSGDLQFTDTNDYNMLGASYRDIDNIINTAINKSPAYIFSAIEKVNEPRAFCTQIYKNRFKYKLPFPGFHINNDLEDFRINYYSKILKAAEDWLWFNV